MEVFLECLELEYRLPFVRNSYQCLFCAFHSEYGQDRIVYARRFG